MPLLSLLVRVLVCLSLALGSASPALAQARMHGLEAMPAAAAASPGVASAAGGCHHRHGFPAAMGQGTGQAMAAGHQADATATQAAAHHDTGGAGCCDHGACSCDCAHMSPCTALATLLVARALPSGAVLGALPTGRPEPRLPGRIRPPNA
jgi:hypothetical protein